MVMSSNGPLLEAEDHARDAAFNKALHGDSAAAKGGLVAMFKKDSAAKKAACDEYFKHWDNKDAKDETAADRAVSLAIWAPASTVNAAADNVSVSRRGKLNMPP